MKKFKDWDEVRQWLLDGKSVSCSVNTYWVDHWHCYDECCCEGEDYTIEEMMEWIQERAVDLEELEAYVSRH